MQRHVEYISTFNRGVLQLAPGKPRELRVRKKIRIVNRTRFAISMSILMFIIISTSMIAFASMGSITLDSNSLNGPKVTLIDFTEQSEANSIEKSSGEVPSYYTVKPGDTLWSIASHLNEMHYNNKRDIREVIHDIQNMNHISNTIYAGQTLELPL